jgi:hypothetical protein
MLTGSKPSRQNWEINKKSSNAENINKIYGVGGGGMSLTEKCGGERVNEGTDFFICLWSESKVRNVLYMYTYYGVTDKYTF